jgi:hypothetical protein
MTNTPVLDLTGPNSWQRVYFATHRGDPNNRKYKAPYIDAFEIPLIFEKRVLAVSTSLPLNEIKPTWRTAGWLTQVFSRFNLKQLPPFFESANSPTIAVDYVKERITINTVQLVIFPRVVANFYLWFDPCPWIKNLSMAIWEFQGDESVMDEQIEALRIDVLRAEQKVNLLLDRY